MGSPGIVLLLPPLLARIIRFNKSPMIKETAMTVGMIIPAMTPEARLEEVLDTLGLANGLDTGEDVAPGKDDELEVGEDEIPVTKGND